ncbi:hypothetical protein [Polyangium sorediatum]|uniref:Uncharacterized protein n=1 Tax=Polyangium sorediatum TaxID=889274 RepID=A0ABT6P484_9BACT|nr:hypothetical protein [Polyangium sorediatum]MDI1435420.1 hypothetical protein [Polyangium sorediatum]
MSNERIARPDPRCTAAYARRSDGVFYVGSSFWTEAESGANATPWFALTPRETERFHADPAMRERIGLSLVGSDHRLYVTADKIKSTHGRRAFHGVPAGEPLTAILIAEAHKHAAEIVTLALIELRASMPRAKRPRRVGPLSS